MMKKLTAFLTALLCMSNLTMPVSAKRADIFRDAIESTNEENVIFIDGRTYMPLYSIHQGIFYYMITTDGTVLTEEADMQSENVQPWDEWYALNLASQRTFNYIAETPQPEDTENTYIVWAGGYGGGGQNEKTPDEAAEELREYAQTHDFVTKAELVNQLDYHDAYASQLITIITPFEMELTREDFPELEIFGENGEFVDDYLRTLQLIDEFRPGSPYPTAEDFDGEREYRFTFYDAEDHRAIAEENNLTNREDWYYFLKGIEQQINANHPDVIACAAFGYLLIANEGISTYKTETVYTAETIPGDVDGDGKINILDTILINRAVLGKIALTDSQKQSADINHDDAVTAEDSLLILKYLVGLIYNFD